jgi:AcrR family transcriptional regulator
VNSLANAIWQAMERVEPETDGRRARSLISRAKIIKAMIELVAAGDPDPSAATVAERTGISLRTVFRHFEEKDAILSAIDDLLVAAYQPVLIAPYRADDWQEQLLELIERRCAVNEAAAIFRVSALMQRYRSPFVAAKYRRLYAAEKRMLDAVLPAALRTETAVGRAILMACSFDSWRLLRQDEELTAAQVVAAIKDNVSAIVQRAAAF